MTTNLQKELTDIFHFKNHNHESINHLRTSKPDVLYKSSS